MKEYDLPIFEPVRIFIIIILIPSAITAACIRQRCCVPSTCTTLYCIQSNSEAWNSTQSYSNYQYTKLVMVNNQCKPCSYNCKKCSSQSACTECYDGFYMEGSICKNCQYKCLKCQVINSLSKCSLCDLGSYLDSNTLSCKSCPDGAKTCTSPTSIIECNTGYLKSSNSLFCTPCTSNCNSCPSSSSTCSSCTTGYYLASGNCKICNITNCITCASQTLCTTCLEGYFRINSTTCSSCPLNCKTCTSSILCTVCKTGYYIQGGGCSLVLSLIDSCSIYSNSTVTGKNKCTTCVSGYYLSQTSLSCFPCSILCNICYGGHFGRCSSCKSNAKLFNQICLPLTFIDQRKMQAYFSASTDGGSGGLLSNGEITCDGLLYRGVKIQLKLDNLAAYKITITYKIFSDVSSQQYTISLNSTTTSSSLSTSNSSFNSLTQVSSSLSYAVCSSIGDTKQYSSHINSLSFSEIKLQNTLSFSSILSSLNIYLSQVLLTIYKCESLCLQCSESLCFTCMNKNLYKQDAYCVYACGKGYYTYQAGKSCLKQCPIGTYALLTNISCMTCQKPCLTCLNSKYCLSCIEGYYLNTLTYTCEKQCPYRYYGSIKTQKCQRCVGRCNQCISDEQCLSCDIGFLENTTCVDDCLIGFYENIETLKCQNCSISCLSCKYKPDFCLTCGENKLLHNNTCVSKCPSGFFSKTNTSYCDKCIYPCQTCQNENSFCITCVDGFFINNTCLSSCPISYYQDTVKLSCVPCNIFCTKCTQQGNYCIQCKNNYKLLDNRCLLDCPSGYYPQLLTNTTMKICSKCVGSCLTCLNQTFCLTCNSNFLASNNSGQCVRSSSCQITQFANINTLKCESCSIPCITCIISSTTCTACQAGSILYNNTCVSSCPSQYFYSSQINISSQGFSTCLACQQPCLTCIDQNKCLSCIQGYKYSSSNNICSSTCSIGSFFNKTINDCQSCSVNCLNCINSNFCFICQSNNFLLILSSNQNKCVSQCPAQFYADSLSCMNCLYPCKNCKSSIDCLSCQNGVLYQNRCLSGCPESTFMDIANNICQNCIGFCLTCKNSATKCTSCKNSYYLIQSSFQCVQFCPNGTYKMQLTKSCISCPDTCSNCLNNSYCTSCIPGKTFLQTSSHMCLQYCPAGFFGSNQTNKCQKCDSKCLTCSNFSQCLTCGDNFVLVRLQNASFDCNKICPSQYYNDSNICYKCLFPCKNCISASQCLTCSLGTYYHSQSYSCLLSCPLGTYYESLNTFSCINCLHPCQTCKNSTNCISCQSGFLLFQGLCIKNCPEKYYADGSGICNRCYGLCQTCLGKYECLTCQTGFAYSGYCYSACPPGTFASENTKKCEPCASPCLECTSTQSYCKKCLNNLLAYRGTCSQKCPDGTYINGQICETCQFPCIKCSNQFTCQKCIGGYLLYMRTSCIANVQKCPNDLYKMNSNQCVPSTWCPENYYKQEALKTCSLSCSRQKYVNDIEKSCLTICGEGQYVSENMVCKNWVLEPPKSVLGMQTLSFVQSSQIHIIIKFNQSISWLQKSNALYSIKSLQFNRRLLSVSQSSINYTQSSTEELILEVKELGYNIEVNLEAYKLKSLVTSYNLQTSTIKVQIPQFTAYTYDSIYIGSIMKQFSEGMSWFIILFSMFFLFMNRLSDVYILWDTSQLLYLLIFLDMQYPPNLNQFLSGLSNINFLFIPSLLSSIAPKQRLKSTQSFYAYSYDNSFARTAGSPLLLAVIVVAIYLLLKLVEGLAKWSQKFKEKLDEYPKLKSRIYKGILRFRWHHTSDVFFLTYNIVVLFSVAQIYYLRQNPNNIGSNVICIVSLIIYLLFPAFVSYKLYRHFGNISKGKMVANLQCFYRGIQKTNKFGISLILIRYFRKLTYGLLIGIFSKQPMFILPILMFTSVLLGLFTFINKPFKKRLSNIITVGTEIGLVIVYLMMALIKFGKDSFTADLKMVLGWVCCGVLLIILFALIFEIFCKTMFYLQSQKSSSEAEANKKQVGDEKMRSLGQITKKYGEQYIRKKAGQFFDKMLPKLKQHFNLDDSQQELNDQYEEGDSQNSQNNLEREKNWGFDSSNSSQKRSDQFRHYGGDSQQNQSKKAQKPPTYLIRCVKQIQ